MRYGTDRPDGQVPGLMAKYGASVKPLILRRTLSRGEALAIEKGLVTTHVGVWKEMPREQMRPDAF